MTAQPNSAHPQALPSLVFAWMVHAYTASGAVLAFAIPWLTHFADRGFSVALVLLWLGLLITGCD